MATVSKHKQKKSLEVVEVTFTVPQDQLNLFKQLGMRYILDHNDQEIAYKLLNMTHTKSKDDVRLWSDRN